MDFLKQNWSDIMLIFTSLVTISSIIVKITPSKKDDTALAKVLKVFEILALTKKVK